MTFNDSYLEAKPICPQTGDINSSKVAYKLKPWDATPKNHSLKDIFYSHSIFFDIYIIVKIMEKHGNYHPNTKQALQTVLGFIFPSACKSLQGRNGCSV